MRDGGVERIKRALKVDSKNAQATCQEDEDNIKKMIAAESSFDTVNAAVSGALSRTIGIQLACAFGLSQPGGNAAMLYERIRQLEVDIEKIEEENYKLRAQR